MNVLEASVLYHVLEALGTQLLDTSEKEWWVLYCSLKNRWFGYIHFLNIEFLQF